MNQAEREQKHLERLIARRVWLDDIKDFQQKHKIKRDPVATAIVREDVSTFAQQWGKWGNDAPMPIKRGRGRPTKAEAEEINSHNVVIRSISPEITGIAYCKEMGRQGLDTLSHWQKQGCPKKYVDAYKTKWNHEIWRERSKT